LIADMIIDDHHCYVTYLAASGKCSISSLNQPKVEDNLAKLSTKVDLLVASCEGGLVPFHRNESTFNVEQRIRRLNSIDSR